MWSRASARRRQTRPVAAFPARRSRIVGWPRSTETPDPGAGRRRWSSAATQSPAHTRVWRRRWAILQWPCAPHTERAAGGTCLRAWAALMCRHRLTTSWRKSRVGRLHLALLRGRVVSRWRSPPARWVGRRWSAAPPPAPPGEKRPLPRPWQYAQTLSRAGLRG